MPDESCRKCSGNLTGCTQCAVCKKAVSRICRRCGTRTLEEFHNYCFYPVTENQHGVVTLMNDEDWRWKKEWVNYKSSSCLKTEQEFNLDQE